MRYSMDSVKTTAGHGTPCPYMKHFHCFRVSQRLMTTNYKIAVGNQLGNTVPDEKSVGRISLI